MNKGTLSFALNGENFGVAFTNDSLKKGPLYAAVSLLHLAGCGIRTGVPTPGKLRRKNIMNIYINKIIFNKNINIFCFNKNLAYYLG